VLAGVGLVAGEPQELDARVTLAVWQPRAVIRAQAGDT
jgi:hypothetical protein